MIVLENPVPRAWRTESVDETRAVGRELAARLEPDGCLLLIGELGAGKTVLVQGLAAALGIDPGEIQSPTYTLVREHRGRARLIHLDLYRLDPDEVAAEGVEELLLGPGVKAVEWAERLPFDVPGAIALVIGREGETRTLRIADPASLVGKSDVSAARG